MEDEKGRWKAEDEANVVKMRFSVVAPVRSDEGKGWWITRAEQSLLSFVFIGS